MKQKLALSLAAMLLPLSAAAANEPLVSPASPGGESGISFPNDTTIKTWQADGEDGIWIQSRQGGWYYGKFATICRDLNFVQVIGVDNRGSARLDRFSTILVGRQRCPLTSFVTSPPPPTKAELKAAREAEKAAKSN